MPGAAHAGGRPIVEGTAARRAPHVTAAGRPDDVADVLSGYVVGARTLTLIPVADHVLAALEPPGEVRLLLGAPVPA